MFFVLHFEKVSRYNKMSTAATALVVLTVVCPENQPNSDWLIDVVSVVDGELIASSKLICRVL